MLSISLPIVMHQFSRKEFEVKIGIVAPPWVPIPPLAYGGTELVIDTLARGLSVAGHDVRLFASGDSTCPVPTEFLLQEAEGFRIANSTVEIRHLIAAYDALGDDCDIIHDHTLIGPVYGPSRTKTPIVATNHFPFSEETAEVWQTVTKGKGKIIGISEHHSSLASEGITVDKVIHHGVDLSRFPDGTGEGGYLAFLGRMVAEKGVHIAARIARETGMPLKIAAKMREEPEKEYFEKEVKPLLGDGVEYLGELGPRDKLDLLSSAKALLNPIQWHEPFGMVMIEAMACGTPVLVFPSGAAPEIVTDGLTGFICKDEKAMIKAVSQIDTISRRVCRWEVETSFSMQRMVKDHVDFYSKVIEDSANFVDVKETKSELSLR